MKKASVMSTISLVIYILSLLFHLTGKAFYYIPRIDMGLSLLVLLLAILFEVPVILGSILLIAGIKPAAKNKARAIYPIGFLVLMLPFIFNIVGILEMSTAQAVLITLMNALPMITALLLLALDNFIRPRNKVMGIIGAVLIMLTMTLFLVLNSAQPLHNVNIYPNATGPIVMADSILYHIGYWLLSIAALLFVIGRPSRADFAMPAPKPVYPSYGYQPPQMPQYNQPQPPQNGNNLSE